MVSLGRFRRVAREWVAAALGLTAMAIAAAVYFHGSSHVSHTLTISAGSADGLRHQIATHLVETARRQGIRLRILPTSGSEEALGLIDSGAIDLALVQGGLDYHERPNVRQVAPLKIEPLHLLVKSEIEPKTPETLGLEFLRGKTVNLSAVGSGTYELSREVLSFAGLKADNDGTPGDYLATTLSYGDLRAESDRGKLPDAVFMVSALPSPVAKHLITRQGYQIIPLRFGEAFALDPLHAPSPIRPREQTAASTPFYAVDRVHVYNTEIPAYTYSLAPPVPPQPVPTFGTRLLLVARKGADATAIARLLKAAYAIGPGGSVLDPTLSGLPPEVDWHEGTLAYHEESKPLVLADAVELVNRWISLIGVLLSGLFFLWQWYRQRVRRRSDDGFEAYILRVAEVERNALQYELGATLDLKELIRLQTELSRLKLEALQRFADGELEGEELMSGFVTHVNDARNYLTRLILHERDNLEDEAVAQNRAPEAVWNEEVRPAEGTSDPTRLVDLDRDFDNLKASFLAKLKD